MVSLKKCVSCKCGASNCFEFNSEMAVEEISVTARCPSCNANLSISVSSMLSPPQSPPPEMHLDLREEKSEMPSSSADEETRENVEQAVRDLFNR